jgi:hypothetical protein
VTTSEAGGRSVAGFIEYTLRGTKGTVLANYYRQAGLGDVPVGRNDDQLIGDIVRHFQQPDREDLAHLVKELQRKIELYEAKISELETQLRDASAPLVEDEAGPSRGRAPVHIPPEPLLLRHLARDQRANAGQITFLGDVKTVLKLDGNEDIAAQKGKALHFLQNLFKSAKHWRDKYQHPLTLPTPRPTDIYVSNKILGVNLGPKYRDFLSWYRRLRITVEGKEKYPLSAYERLSREQLAYKRALQQQFSEEFPNAGPTAQIRWEAHLGKIRTRGSVKEGWSVWQTYPLDAATLAALRA